MRYQGKISSWKDNQGFGFVTPNRCGQKAFVHIKAFLNNSTRPVDGDLITYELAKDEKNRFYAKNIKFVSNAPSMERYKTRLIPTYFATLFLFSLLILSLTQRLPLTALVSYVVITFLTFILYAMDKSAAKNSQRRISENTLHLFSLLGGWPGAVFAQKTLHHKSKKVAFQTTFWITVALNCLAISWLMFSNSGMEALNAIFDTFH
jgi:uncharacterized membrane protein YsdA (DUF1294 family)/cold shock CspA family protein